MKLRKKILLTAGVIGLSIPAIAETSYQCLSCPAGTYSAGGTTTSCTSCLSIGVKTCDSITGKATGCQIGFMLNSDNKCENCQTKTTAVQYSEKFSGYAAYLYGSSYVSNNTIKNINIPQTSLSEDANDCFTPTINSISFHSTKTSSGSFSLEGGKYIMILYGAGGGPSKGKADSTCGMDDKSEDGGNGEITLVNLTLNKTTAINCSMGKKGSWTDRYNGTDGGNTSCTVEGITYIARGGGGAKDGKNGTSYSSYVVNFNGYGNEYRDGPYTNFCKWHDQNGGANGMVAVFKYN